MCLLCLAGRFALNAPCPVDGDRHIRSHTLGQSRQRPRGSQRAGSWPPTVGGGRREGRSRFPAGCWEDANPVGAGLPQVPRLWPEHSHQVPSPPGSAHGSLLTWVGGTCRESRPPGGLSSAIALTSENLQECSGDGITWNCLFFLGGGQLNKTHTSFLCQVLVWTGQLCVGVFLFSVTLFCFLMMFTICLNRSVFYKDSTSSPLPSPTQAFEAVRRCLKNSTKYQSKSNFAHIYIYIQKETFQ